MLRMRFLRKAIEQFVAIVGDNLKTKEERIMSRRGVQFVDTCDLTSRGYYGDKHGFCPRCVDDRAYRRLSGIIDRNTYITYKNNLKDLYDALKADGAPLPDYDVFERYMGKPANRRELYEALKADVAVESPTYEEFMRRLTSPS